MRLAVADTGPINYLILIEQIDLFSRLCERTVIPVVAQAKLTGEFAPLPVRRWIAGPPAWLQIVRTSQAAPVAGIPKGKAAPIALAASLLADLLLMGVVAAERQGVRVTGTLGVLASAADWGMIDFAEAILKLETTSFRKPIRLLQALLDKHKGH